MGRAFVRGIPSSFAEATAAVPAATPIDTARARAQHAAYAAALESLGVEVRVLAADDRLPDCCFVEDQAVVRDGVALITRSGHPPRRPEASAVAEALAPHVALHFMTSPATLDGGDVLAVRGTIFVGRSARTNAEGVAALRRVFGPLGYRVVEVALPPDVLHLKCVCAPLGPERILLAEGALAADVFDGFEVVSVPASEAYAANVVAVGDHVLVAAGYPRTAQALVEAGLVPVPLETTEFAKADGSLTCLSVFY